MSDEVPKIVCGDCYTHAKERIQMDMHIFLLVAWEVCVCACALFLYRHTSLIVKEMHKD